MKMRYVGEGMILKSVMWMTGWY